jgi:hypothetical protein
VLTGDIKYLIGGALLQALLVAVLAAVVHPELTTQSIVCAVILVAAELVVYREIRGMKAVSAQTKRVPAAPERKQARS